jgi:hypothetical protein
VELFKNQLENEASQQRTPAVVPPQNSNLLAQPIYIFEDGALCRNQLKCFTFELSFAITGVEE